MLRISNEQFDEVIDTNLRGVFYCTKAVLPAMVEQGVWHYVMPSVEAITENSQWDEAAISEFFGSSGATVWQQPFTPFI